MTAETDTRKDTVADESGGQSGSKAPRRQSGRQIMGEPDAPTIGDWLYFTPFGTVDVFSGKAEVGQGVRTELAQSVADELRMPLEHVRVVLADTARTPFDMGTFGSRSTPHMVSLLRKVAASARELLLDRAAERWSVGRAELQVAEGKVTDPSSGRSLAFAELIDEEDEGRPHEEWSDDAPVTPAEQWTVAGKSAPRIDGRDFVTGRHRYTTDLSRPGMLIGRVLRPPVFGATLASVDTSAVEAMTGVTVVHDGDFVGAAAPARGLASKALAAIRAEWNMPDPSEQVAQEDLFEYLKAHPTEPEPGSRWSAAPVFEEGSLEKGRTAGRNFQASYTVAYIAHVPLETRAALAEWQDGHLTVWTGTQRPFGVRTELAAAFGLPEEQVRVIVPDTGAGYGGKHTGDAAIEAARLAKGAGRPVRLVWSREEEFTWAYFRPAGLIEIKSAVADDGRVTAWDYTNYNSGSAAMYTPYNIENQRVAYQMTKSPLRQGSYRALAATANHFARESHMGELAHLAGMNPLDFRLRNITDERLRNVLLAATERFGWSSRQKAEGRGYGLACGTEKASYVATCAEVEVDRQSGGVRIIRVVEAFECGAIVNPDNLANQVEGCIVQAIGGALFEHIDFAEGKILTDRLSRYRVPRFSDVPDIDLVLLDRKDIPSAGAGETPIVGLAPAVANAIFDATGNRLRALPLAP